MINLILRFCSSIHITMNFLNLFIHIYHDLSVRPTIWSCKIYHIFNILTQWHALMPFIYVHASHINKDEKRIAYLYVWHNQFLVPQFASISPIPIQTLHVLFNILLFLQTCLVSRIWLQVFNRVNITPIHQSWLSVIIDSIGVRHLQKLIRSL